MFRETEKALPARVRGGEFSARILPAVLDVVASRLHLPPSVLIRQLSHL